jgi:hypothetical protein
VEHRVSQNSISGHGIQICFCAGGGNALPVFPLEAHDSLCLVWDWAAANGKITPQQHLAKLEGAVTELGITQEELDREEHGMSEKADALERFLAEDCPACGTPGPVRHLSAVGGCKTCADSDPRPVFIYPVRSSQLSAPCYRTAGGQQVHVKPGCRCRR